MKGGLINVYARLAHVFMNKIPFAGGLSYNLNWCLRMLLWNMVFLIALTLVSFAFFYGVNRATGIVLFPYVILFWIHLDITFFSFVYTSFEKWALIDAKRRYPYYIISYALFRLIVQYSMLSFIWYGGFGDSNLLMVFHLLVHEGEFIALYFSLWKFYCRTRKPNFSL
jgi:hypothetical protein